MIFKEKFTAGETITKTLNIQNYPATDWTLSIAIRGASKLDETAVANGNNFDISVDTSLLSAGFYSYQAKVTKGSEVHFVESGNFTVEANIFTSDAGYDGRSHARIMLDAIEALLQNRANDEHKRLKINNRELEHHSFKELLELRDYYRAEISRANLKKRGTFKNIGIKF